MILSASRRTDIPAFYSDWFVNRLKEGYVLVPNPYNTKQLSRISLSPENIDCIVFWTKNASPILGKLDSIEKYGYKDYYFEFTITAYDGKIEKGLPDKCEIIRAFQHLSDSIGAKRVDWRFDPIIINESVTEDLILNQFEKMCEQLARYTTKCIISFIDIYKHTNPAFKVISHNKQEYIAKHLSEIASSYNLPLYTCSEEHDFSLYDIKHSACIDREKIESIIGCKLDGHKDAGQRKVCGCIESIDIGIYNTCCHGCTYCYATKNLYLSEKNKLSHDPHSPMLIGTPSGKEVITCKTAKTLKAQQLPFTYEE